MQLSIITINYNSSERTNNLSKSLAEQIDPSTKFQASKDFQTIVIDNASEEVDFNKLSISQADNLKIVKNDKNLGFSGGNNVGIRQALKNGADWLLLLNNDTWVESNFIASLKAKLSQLEGIAGIPLIESGNIAYCGKVAWLKPTLNHTYSAPIVRHRKTDNYAIGGGVAVHKKVFEKIGLLDEKYFLYFEDADFSLRAQRAGFKLTILEEPKAYHQVSASTKKLGSSLLLYYHYRNALYFNLKNGPWYIKFLVWPWSWIVIIKQLIKIAIKQNRNESEAILKGVTDFYNGIFGKITND